MRCACGRHTVTRKRGLSIQRAYRDMEEHSRAFCVRTVRGPQEQPSDKRWVRQPPPLDFTLIAKETH